jgi:hypothetical protein
LLKLAYLAAGCGAVFVAWGILKPETPRPPTLQERWNNAVQELPPLIPGPRVVKTDRIVPAQPRPDFGWVTGVDVKKIDPIPVPAPVVVETPQPRAKVVREKKIARASSDVCSVHGQRKVYTGKYKWRCRK